MQFAVSPSLPARPASCTQCHNLATTTSSLWRQPYLVVVCHGLRNRVVNNVAHVRFVDPHPEGYSGANKLDLAFAPLVVAKRAVVWFQSCMVKRDLTGFARVLKPQRFDQLLRCLLAILFGQASRTSGTQQVGEQPSFSTHLSTESVGKRTNR